MVTIVTNLDRHADASSICNLHVCTAVFPGHLGSPSVSPHPRLFQLHGLRLVVDQGELRCRLKNNAF